MRIIRNGKVCDGSGTEPVSLDVVIKDNLIADLIAPGSSPDADAEIIDAHGLLVSPGFIDAHAHSDTRKLQYPQNRSKLLQGVTTEVDGNCGSSPSCVPGEKEGLHWNNLSEYAEVLNARGCSTNTVVLCGHNSLRRSVMGNRSDAANTDEIKAMRKLLEQAFEAGAAGWSSGLTYFPGKFADTKELCALSELTKNTKKVYATHMRSEGDTLQEAVEEAIEIARAGSGKLQVSHLKTIFPRNYHKIDRLLESLETARNSGMFLHADRYPYVYSSTRIGQILPAPYDRDPEISAKLKNSADFQAEIMEALKKSPRDLATTILLRTGKTLAETAEENAVSLETAGMRAVMDNAEQTAAYLCMSEKNLARILEKKWVCAGSDGIAAQLDVPGSSGHPRAIGTFPTFFRMVAKTQGISEAVRRMTSLPCSIFRIPQRGLIRKGYIADLVFFDPERFNSLAGFHNEPLMPLGMHQVIVSGKTAWSSAAPEQFGCFGRYLPID